MTNLEWKYARLTRIHRAKVGGIRLEAWPGSDDDGAFWRVTGDGGIIDSGETETVVDAQNAAENAAKAIIINAAHTLSLTCHEPKEYIDPWGEMTFGLVKRPADYLAWLPWGGQGEEATGASEFDAIRNLMAGIERRTNADQTPA